MSDFFEAADNDAKTTQSDKGSAKGFLDDPLEGYVKDVTEERIEGVEAVVERLSWTVEKLMKKVSLFTIKKKKNGGLHQLTSPPYPPPKKMFDKKM